MRLEKFLSFDINEDGNWRALRHRNFRILFQANAVSNIGSWIQRVAQAWLVLELTGSGTYLGIIASLQFAPFLLVSMQGGAMADRLDKRKVLLFTNVLFVLSSLALGLLIVFERVELWHVMVLALVLGFTDGIDKPVRQSYISELVGIRDMPNAISLNSVNFNFGRLVGPAIAGLSIAVLGTGPAFLINGFSYVFVISATLRIRKQDLFEIPKNTGPVKIREGIQYVLARPDIFVTMAACSILATFGFNFEIFNALMATKEFKGGVASFGLLGTAVAVGSLSAALISPRLEKYRSTRFVLAGSVIFCLTLLLISVMPSYLTYVISLPLLGATALTTVIAANSITQLNTDHEIRGRVMGIYQFVFLAGAPFSSPLIGWLSEVIGIRQTIALCSLATLIPIIAISIFFRNRLSVPADISVSAILRKNTSTD
jgi:MFS family permease